MRKKILVTGASGFIGSLLVPQFSEHFDMVPTKVRLENVDHIAMNDIDCVIHLAGLAHQSKATPDDAYYNANYLLTKKLADNALNAGVKQFIYLSSSKVFGESAHETIYDEKTICDPQDPYGKSKLMAENYLNDLAQSSNAFHVAIIRPPLVYGPGAKGNLLALMKLVEKHSLLPLGGIDNHRSMVSINNLIALIKLLIDESAQGTYLISDNKDSSTSELVKLIAKQFDKRTRVFKMPALLRLLLQRVKPALMMRLYDSFVTVPSSNLATLGFQQASTYEDGVADMVHAYLQKK